MRSADSNGKRSSAACLLPSIPPTPKVALPALPCLAPRRHNPFMAATLIPLDRLARQITHQQTELETLRQEYEARQKQLADLTRRRDELHAQLLRVDKEIQAVQRGQGPTPASVPDPKKPAATKKPSAS